MLMNFVWRVIIEFLLPMLTAVLSTPTATQFSQDTPASEIIQITKQSFSSHQVTRPHMIWGYG